MKLTMGMVRHQMWLMSRTVKDLARDPALGREVPRLIATRGRSTTALRLPWLPFRLIDELESFVQPGTRVFEFGGGGSTLWFLDHGASVITVEHSPDWSARLQTLVTSSAWTLLQRDLTGCAAAYVDAILDCEDLSLDVVVVDGRERARCAIATLEKIRPGGLLIVDDVDRERYRTVLESISWPRRDVVGFAPAKPSLAYTAVFTKPH